MKKGNPGKTQEKSTLMKVLSCWQLYVLMIPALVWLILFCYKLCTACLSHSKTLGPGRHYGQPVGRPDLEVLRPVLQHQHCGDGY